MVPPGRDIVEQQFALSGVANREVRLAGLGGADPAEVGLRGSPTRVCRMFKPEREAAGEVLEGDVHQQVAALLERFREIGVVAEGAEPRPAGRSREAG